MYLAYKESAAAIANGGWSSLGAMYSSDEEAEFMSQLLANCCVTNEMNEASSSAIPCAICPSYDFSKSNIEGIYQGSQYSSEIANLYFSNGSVYIMSNNETNHYNGNPNSIMETSYHNSEAFRPSDSNATNLIFIHGKEYGMDHHQELSNVNIENQPGAAIYEKLLQLNRESDHEMTIWEPAMENEVMVSEGSKKRPCSSVDVQKKRTVKAKKGQKAVLRGNVDDNDKTTKGQSSSSSCSGDDDSINASHQDLSGGVSTSSLSPKGKKASRGSATDSQNLYARKRRGKINARLRILQNLVPNGTKVDISTMLEEEAVQYVKFLLLQIKLLSSDDMWMFAPIAYNGINIGIDLNS